ncbi:PREDICTED: secreted frizzled-related protein 3-like isoform X1 [Branchiostoma belcheri]|uniref:Secreted frizzled-related protein 3-like isoform X1 n=1 Tax=Branchiostoma belcheri TaxID=7741 RepID=A0A6P4ZE51_BRABE|nr:PREDICTED: secreted frizzled-related protein 3-like isoform X1 [Branchiostoma belcheri]
MAGQAAWFLPLLAAGLALLARDAGAALCEPITIPMCKKMPWNMTRMPNLLHHSTQENAKLAIEQYESLVNYTPSCSPDLLLFFLCSMYAPICTLEFSQEPIRPCKKVCEGARAACEPVVLAYNHTWPDHLKCDDLPVYELGVCISPEAIVTEEPPELSESTENADIREPGKSREKGRRKQDGVEEEDEKCPKCKRLKASYRNYEKKTYHYVLRVQVKGTETRGDQIATTVTVLEEWKHHAISVPKGEVQLWTNSTCKCPRLKVDQEYIIMGYEDSTNGRLLLLPDTMVTNYSSRWQKRFKKWERRLKRSPGRKRRKGRKKPRSDDSVQGDSPDPDSSRDRRETGTGDRDMEPGNES